jgi:hypothetical protein
MVRWNVEFLANALSPKPLRFVAESKGPLLQRRSSFRDEKRQRTYQPNQLDDYRPARHRNVSECSCSHLSSRLSRTRFIPQSIDCDNLYIDRVSEPSADRPGPPTGPGCPAGFGFFCRTTANREAASTSVTQAERSAGGLARDEAVDFAVARGASGSGAGQVGNPLHRRSRQDADAFPDLRFRHLLAGAQHPLRSGLTAGLAKRNCLRRFHLNRGGAKVYSAGASPIC